MRADGLAGAAQVHWLALAAHCWASPVRAAGADPRDYVDDLVAVCSVRAWVRALGAMWDANLAFAAACGLCMSTEKCVR